MNPGLDYDRGSVVLGKAVMAVQSEMGLAQLVILRHREDGGIRAVVVGKVRPQMTSVGVAAPVHEQGFDDMAVFPHVIGEHGAVSADFLVAYQHRRPPFVSYRHHHSKNGPLSESLAPQGSVPAALIPERENRRWKKDLTTGPRSGLVRDCRFRRNDREPLTCAERKFYSPILQPDAPQPERRSLVIETIMISESTEAGKTTYAIEGEPPSHSAITLELIQSAFPGVLSVRRNIIEICGVAYRVIAWREDLDTLEIERLTGEEES